MDYFHHKKKYNTDSQMCLDLSSDIDECLTANCPSTCTNSGGSYRCECPVGYIQASDGKQCSGKWRIPLD